MPAPDRTFWEYTDVAGGFLRATNWITHGTAPTTVAVALTAAINGNLLYATSGVPSVGVVTPGGSLYPFVTDLALFNFATIPGSGFQVVVPSPKAALFASDGVTVDPTATLSAAIITAVIGTLTDAAGNLATAFTGGVKASRRTEQT